MLFCKLQPVIYSVMFVDCSEQSKLEEDTKNKIRLSMQTYISTRTQPILLCTSLEPPEFLYILVEKWEIGDLFVQKCMKMQNIRQKQILHNSNEFESQYFV